MPTYIISKLISKKYKVAISGDGGDELTGLFKISAMFKAQYKA